ncbi:hypothetical protein AAGF08_14760 [Algoriphagus sp. SE2]|uniref:hypothetical protein n=1 Tax=Algoriphagus sp. SE2 TaxID=3141536 RepID=UPI0031CD211E
MKPDFNEIFDELKKGASELSSSTLNEYKDEAEADLKDFLSDSKASLERWTLLLASGDLTKKDFEWLVQSQKDLLVMKALSQAGLSKIRLDQFKTGSINLVIGTILNKISKPEQE